MDPNLLYWKTKDQSFSSRLQTWLNLLDPTLLLASEPEIQKAHTLLGRVEDLGKEDEAAVTLSLSSVHDDSGAPLPLFFRAPAVIPFSGLMVVASLVPHRKVPLTLSWQFLLQSYWAGFNFANRNSSSEQQGAKTSLRQLVMMAGTISYTACVATLPHIMINRMNVSSPPIQTFCRSVLPIPLSAALAFFNVFAIRSDESETGIQVFDQHGNLVGVSKAAGKQAVNETALSRAVLFGTTAALPHLLLLLLQRTRLFQRNSLLSMPIHHASTLLFLSLMLPVSFSLFPQLGTIKREKLEEELQAGAAGPHLFYHRGL